MTGACTCLATDASVFGTERVAEGSANRVYACRMWHSQNLCQLLAKILLLAHLPQLAGQLSVFTQQNDLSRISHR